VPQADISRTVEFASSRCKIIIKASAFADGTINMRPYRTMLFSVGLNMAYFGGAVVVASDDVLFPADFAEWVHYATYNEAGDRPELLATGQLRELYAKQATLDAVRAGKPLPYGTVLVRVRYDVVRDSTSKPIQDTNGRMIKSKLLGFGIMEKRAGGGKNHPDGEWEYRGFTADRQPNVQGIQPADCYSCHRSAQDLDYVFSHNQMKSKQ